MTFTVCPDPACGALAEVVDERMMESTDGPVCHRLTLCLNGHRYDSSVAAYEILNPEGPA